MKKVGDLMKDIGFTKEAPQGTKEAFIKHLIKASTGVSVETPTEKKLVENSAEKVSRLVSSLPEQLTFDFAHDVVKKKSHVS